VYGCGFSCFTTGSTYIIFHHYVSTHILETAPFLLLRVSFPHLQPLLLAVYLRAPFWARFSVAYVHWGIVLGGSISILLKAGDSIQPLLDCLGDVNKWLTNNFLQLNLDKTQIFVFGPPILRGGLINEFRNCFSSISSQVRNLGIILDSELCLTMQAN